MTSPTIMTPQLLRLSLEEIWKSPKLACPCHLARWNTTGIGYLKFAEFGLFYQQGKPRGPKRLRIKGKGYSIIYKGYGVVSRISWRFEKIVP